jgi:pectate lyase
MRQYLFLVWILGSIVACSGNGSEGDGSDPTPTAGRSGAGAAGMPAATAGAATGTAGTGPTAGTSSTAGSSATGGGGSNGSAGTATGGVPAAAGANSAGAAGGVKTMMPTFKFPTPVGADQNLSATKDVSDFDGKGARFVGTGALGGSSQDENQGPLFSIKAGGSLKNVILGAPAADGVHCEGSCTIDNVWWEDVGEDAITLLGNSASNVYRISNSGARKASDKVIQHNGGGTLYVKNFLVESFGKLYRSCGNCSTQNQRKSEFDTIVANGTGELAGVNATYKDSAKFTNIFAATGMKICERYNANNTGAEPTSAGVGSDGTYCIYAATDISWH